MHQMNEIMLLQMFESNIRSVLPADYRDYLLRGSPWQARLHTLEFHVSHGVDVVDVCEPYVIDERRYPGTSVTDVFRILSAREQGEGLLPAGCIAIASTTRGDHVLLFVSGERAGQIWLKSWKRLEEEDVDEPEADLVPLAKSFSEFLDAIGEGQVDM